MRSAPEDSWRRWTRWTWHRALLSIVWIAITSLVAFALTVFAWFVESDNFIGRPHHPLTLPALIGIASLLLASGPVLLWVLRRTRRWLLLGLACLSLVALSAFSDHPTEAVRDQIGAVRVPTDWSLLDEEVGGAGAPLFGERHRILRTLSTRNSVATSCETARESLGDWSEGRPIRDHAPGSNLAQVCAFSSFKDDVEVAVTVVVYDKAGWARHAEVIEPRFSLPDEAISIIKIEAWDTSA